MSIKDKTYLQLIPFQLLENWSVQYYSQSNFTYNNKYELVKIGDFLKRNKTPIDILDNESYKRVTIKINNGGVFLRDTEKGEKIGTKKQFIISKGQFLLSKIDARNGAFGVVPESLEGAIITGNFWTFDVDYSKINPHFLSLIATTPEFIRFSENASNGTTNRHYLQEDLFLKERIPLPSVVEQEKIVRIYNQKVGNSKELLFKASNLEKEINSYLVDELGIQMGKVKSSRKDIQTIKFKDLNEWGIDKIFSTSFVDSTKYAISSLETFPDLVVDIFRGKSPKYDSNSEAIILNQKCNRWNNIELNHAKKVDRKWLSSIDPRFLTKTGDIVINSTGEGTIGRATCISEDFQGLLYDSHILLLRLFKLLIYPEYFVYVFNSQYVQDQINSIKSAQSTNQTELGIGNLTRIQFPYPPIETQIKLVKRINQMKSEIEKATVLSENILKESITEFENQIFAKR